MTHPHGHTSDFLLDWLESLALRGWSVSIYQLTHPPSVRLRIHRSDGTTDYGGETLRVVVVKAMSDEVNR